MSFKRTVTCIVAMLSMGGSLLALKTALDMQPPSQATAARSAFVEFRGCVARRVGVGYIVYELHVWAWRDNPHGVVDWNPRVSCEGQ